MADPIKVAYLFGAGATHAERYLECKLENSGLEDGRPKIGLTSEDVSKGVIDALLKKHSDRLEVYGIDENWAKPTASPKKVDIEFFISMLETLKTPEAEKDARLMRELFYKEINNRLHINKSKIKPRLHAALLEWHKLNRKNEHLVGFLSVNYDSMLEEAHYLTEAEFDYGFNADISDSNNNRYRQGARYLLKLHGSFDWRLDPADAVVRVTNSVPTDKMLWIPPRLNKDYLGYPYNTLQGTAEEVLRECEVLRIIGCSLSQNDLGLIALIFKTQKTGERNRFVVEYIGSEEGLQRIVKRLGILLTFDEESFYTKPDFTIWGEIGTKNYLLDWLFYKVKNSNKDMRRTKYLKNVKSWIKIV